MNDKELTDKFNAMVHATLSPEEIRMRMPKINEKFDPIRSAELFYEFMKKHAVECAEMNEFINRIYSSANGDNLSEVYVPLGQFMDRFCELSRLDIVKARLKEEEQGHD